MRDISDVPNFSCCFGNFVLLKNLINFLKPADLVRFYYSCYKYNRLLHTLLIELVSNERLQSAIVSSLHDERINRSSICTIKFLVDQPICFVNKLICLRPEVLQHVCNPHENTILAAIMRDSSCIEHVDQSQQTEQLCLIACLDHPTNIRHVKIDLSQDVLLQIVYLWPCVLASLPAAKQTEEICIAAGWYFYL